MTDGTPGGGLCTFRVAPLSENPKDYDLKMNQLSLRFSMELASGWASTICEKAKCFDDQNSDRKSVPIVF